MSDAEIARIGRNIAEAIRAFARSRRDDDRRAITLAEVELCAAVRAEIEEQKIAAALMEQKEKVPTGLAAALSNLPPDD
jgi:hypothetical protein